MNINGTLKLKKETQKINDTFKKREFVINENQSKYPQVLLFQVTQANCDLLDQFNEGDELSITFNLRGREWTSPSGEIKYFTSLEAWRIEKAGNGTNTMTGTEKREPVMSNPTGTDSFGSGEAENDLPF
jgi:hypothetical protein